MSRILDPTKPEGGAPVASPVQAMVQIVADCTPDGSVNSCAVAGYMVCHTKGGIALPKPELTPWNEAQIWSFTLEMMRNRLTSLGATPAEMALHVAYSALVLEKIPE